MSDDWYEYLSTFSQNKMNLYQYPFIALTKSYYIVVPTTLFLFFPSLYRVRYIYMYKNQLSSMPLLYINKQSLTLSGFLQKRRIISDCHLHWYHAVWWLHKVKCHTLDSSRTNDSTGNIWFITVRRAYAIRVCRRPQWNSTGCWSTGTL